MMKMRYLVLFSRRHMLKPHYNSMTCPAMYSVATSNYLIKSNNLQKKEIRKFSSEPDYGKYSDPDRIERFYSWIVDTSWMHCVESYLATVHDVTGLPWWSSIMLCTVALRGIVMTPLFIMQLKNSIKYRQFLSLFTEIQQKLSVEVEESAKEKKWDDKIAFHQYRVNLKRHRDNIYKQYKVPGVIKRYILPLVQIPLWISLSFSMRHLTLSLPITYLDPNIYAIANQLSVEGCCWFNNLCLFDPYYVLPFLFGLLNLSIIEIHRGDGKTPLVGFGKVMIYAVRTLSIIMIPVACQMPSGVVFYWFCSSMYGAIQALVFRSHKVKHFFRIPISSLESKTPYRDLFERLKFLKDKK